MLGISYLQFAAQTEEVKRRALAELWKAGDCRVCLLEMAEGELCYTLECGHRFHLEVRLLLSTRLSPSCTASASALQPFPFLLRRLIRVPR